ncbi:MAG TPA: DNA recombination protein RmuC [Verrucomicrobiae bacterium]|nr:DNA recombination protein RmuC [Verrucomicrobiae bacterium]
MNPALYILLGFALGSGVGFLIGWLLESRNRHSNRGQPDSRLEQELRQQLSQREADLDRLRQELTAAGQARITAESGRAAADTALRDQRSLHEQSFTQLRESSERALADLREAFKALSVDALKQTQPEFLRLANESLAKFHETAKGDLAQRQQSIATLLEPLKQQLETYQRHLQQSELSQSTSLGEVRKHLETLAEQSHALSTETVQLRRILSSNQARGRWGEATLRRVVEAAGLSAHCDFTTQTVSDDSKPDLIVHLPGDRMIIVDSKMPDPEFLQALETESGANRTTALTAHANKLKSTIRALADRDYPGQFPASLDYVVLFLPAESLFSAALEGDPELLMWASSRKILVATPASLIGLLRAVAVSWQQQAQTENAREISDAAQELFSRICKFTDHFERIRDGLAKAGSAYNEAVGSYERMVRPSGERLAELSGNAPTRELPSVKPVELGLRSSTRQPKPKTPEQAPAESDSP